MGDENGAYRRGKKPRQAEAIDARRNCKIWFTTVLQCRSPSLPEDSPMEWSLFFFFFSGEPIDRSDRPTAVVVSIYRGNEDFRIVLVPRRRSRGDDDDDGGGSRGTGRKFEISPGRLPRAERTSL